MREVTGPPGFVSGYVHPVDVVQGVCDEEGWDYERGDADEISISHQSQFSSYHISLSWMEDLESLHLACAFDLRVPPTRLKEVKELASLINEQLWIGHFDLWIDDKVVLYRHGHLLPDAEGFSAEQSRRLVKTAIDSCDLYYQSFQFVVWAGKSAAEAMQATLFQTVGEA